MRGRIDMMPPMRWVATVSGTADDVARVLLEGLLGISADPENGAQVLLDVGEIEGDDETQSLAAKELADAAIRHINGIGRLRWGRVFEGLTILSFRSFDADGRQTQRVFIDAATGHMLPEDFANLVERLTGTRPALPEGVDVVEAVDLAVAVKLAAGNADVARALRLVDLMLEGDDEIDWVAGYSALEVVEEDLKARGLNGRALGWWTKSEYKDFAATANSVEALDEYARHGKRFGLADARMTRVQASWFIRRVVAHWHAYLPGSEQGSGDDDSGVL